MKGESLGHLPVIYTHADVVAALRKLTTIHGSGQRLARHLRVSQSYVSKVLNGRERLGLTLVTALGFEIRYIKAGTLPDGPKAAERSTKPARRLFRYGDWPTRNGVR